MRTYTRFHMEHGEHQYHEYANPECEDCRGTGYTEPDIQHPDDPRSFGPGTCHCVVEAMQAIEANRQDHGGEALPMEGDMDDYE